MEILNVDSAGELFQRILLLIALVVTGGCAAFRLADKQGRATMITTIGLLLIVCGAGFALIHMTTYGLPGWWNITISLCGGSVVMCAQEPHDHQVKRKSRWVGWWALSGAFLVAFQAMLFADRWKLGPQPSFRVDAIQIADGVVGQVRYEFTVAGQRLTPCGTDYDYVIYDVEKKKYRKTGTLKGRQVGAVGPVGTVVFDQPIGPFSSPGTLEYRFSPVDRCGDRVYEHPQSDKVARFRVRAK